MMHRVGRLFLVAVAALIGYGIGSVAGGVRHAVPQNANYPFLVEPVPLPHHVPKYRDGLSFRFAMAHDVVHERFPKHGPAWYRERDRVVRAKLDALAPDDPARFPLLDDLAAGLERLGRSDEAVGVMRGKLAAQQAKGISGRELYTTYANLGTFLIHASFGKSLAGDPDAKARFREGVEFVKKSVEVNPQAHFGRERWQQSIAEFLLLAMERPEWLRRYDCLGNDLDLGIESILNREVNWTESGLGRPYDAQFARGEAGEDAPAFFEPGVRLDDPALWLKLVPIRKHITKVGAEAGWTDSLIESHREPAPFDEPVLGIIGMWRQGGGANPHFALALGETMLRVGQRYIAWTAFERASRMADRFSPDPAPRQFLRDHCKKRQGQIEETLRFRGEPRRYGTHWQEVSPPPDPAVVDNLRAQFDKELDYGRAYQAAYQEYEAARIAAGVSIDDEHFFGEFDAGRPPIASKPGPEEWFPRVPRAKIRAFASEQAGAFGIFGAGLGALGSAVFLGLLDRLRARWRRGSFRPAEVRPAELDGLD